MYKSAGRFYSTHGSLANKAVNFIGDTSSNKKKDDVSRLSIRKTKRKKKERHRGGSHELWARLIRRWHLLNGVVGLTPEKFTGNSNRRLVLRVSADSPSWIKLPFALRKETYQYDKLLKSLNLIMKPHKVDIVEFVI